MFSEHNVAWFDCFEPGIPGLSLSVEHVKICQPVPIHMLGDLVKLQSRGARSLFEAVGGWCLICLERKQRELVGATF